MANTVAGFELNPRKGKNSKCFLVGNDNAFDKVTDGDVTITIDKNGDIAKWISTKVTVKGDKRNGLSVRLKCDVEPKNKLAFPEEGTVTITIVNSTPPVDPPPVVYVDDEP